ncbi:MAG: kynureninase [Glaciecola sp.]
MTEHEQAIHFDKNDPLAHKIAAFYLPKNMVYLDGNSLGPLPLEAKQRAFDVVQAQWGETLIESWNKHQWIDLPLTVGNKIAPLIGAQPNSVICCDSISVNLFKVLSAAMLMQREQSPNKKLILSQEDNFPTDLYMAQGLSQLMGQEKCELLSVSSDDVVNTLNQRGSEIAILMLTHVNFKNGHVFDMAGITQAAHQNNVLVLWDLAHSAGVMPLALAQHKVDFAVGCTYKYLNGGPGAPAFVYVAPRHLTALKQPLSGWMGHKKPFEFTHDYEKAAGIEQLLSGTPSVISMSVLDAALNLFDDITVSDIRKKSIALNAFFQECVEPLIQQQLLTLACDDDAKNRGSQISFTHEHAYAICQALIGQKIVADFRAPNVLRIGFSPLFLSFTNVYTAANVLIDIVQNARYLAPEYQVKHKVT